MKLRFVVVVLMLLAVGGCWNGGNTHVQFGDVSIGQQLVDLKAAMDDGAITAQEFEAAKATLLALNSLCENTEADAESESGMDWF